MGTGPEPPADGDAGPAPGPARLIVFTRYPEPGKAKTRLIGRLGAEGAADLHRAMTAHTLAHARAFAARGGAELEVRYEGGDEARMAGAFGGGRRCYVPQGGGDLGDRLARAVEAGFRAGAPAVLVIGSDCPGVTAGLLGRALGRLGGDAGRVVLRPALDGGYYLVGLARAVPGLFAGIAWSTDRVLEQTIERARLAALDVRLLKPLADVDRPEDLDAWYAARDGLGGDRG